MSTPTPDTPASPDTTKVEVPDDHAIHENHPHEHGPGCGHEEIPHGDHVDYLHDGHRHAKHGDHWDEH